MKLWDNDLRNAYKKPELHAYYWCVDFCWKAVERVVDTVKDKANDVGAVAGAVAGKVTKPIAKGIETAGNAFGDTMQKVGDATGLAPIVNTIGEKTGIKELGQNIHAGFKYGAGIMPDEQPAYQTANGEQEGDGKGEQTKAQTDEAATEAAGAGASAEREAANSARESGVNASRSGMMAGVNNQAAGLLNGLYQTAAAQNASTQEDYIDKMAKSDVMDTKAGNMAKGAQIMPWASALQGAGEGAKIGMTLTSDENAKEAVDGIDDKQLNESIAQFKSLYKRLKELKEKQ